MDFFLELEQLKKDGHYRSLKINQSSDPLYIVLNERPLLNFGSNNYMGMTQNEEVKRAMIDGIKEYGTGAGASRLVTGTYEIHDQLERELAVFSKKQASMVFPSGYMANLGLISSIASSKTWLILDKIDHASIIDGARLSGAKIRIYPHKKLDYLELLLKAVPHGYNVWIITDSIFSMDGDAADLKKLVGLKKKYQAGLIVDEAHAVGVFGENGSGLSEELGVLDDVDFKVGTLSKAFGLQGGYISASFDRIDYLRNKCRSFIYTTGIAPCICAGALKVIDLFKGMGDQKKYLRQLAQWFRERLRGENTCHCDSVSQIIPVIIGDAVRVMAAEQYCREKGFFVPAIRYPTVKKGSERIRISLTVMHTKEQLIPLIETLSNWTVGQMP